MTQKDSKVPLRRYRQLEGDLTLAPDGGGVGAVWLDNEIHEACGANLAWNKERLVFTVYIARGSQIKTYMDLTPDKHFPLSSSLVPFISATVKSANAFRSEDPGKAVLEYMSRQKALQDKGLKKYVDDRFPDFRAFAERSWKKLNDRHSRPITMPDKSSAYNLSSP